MPIEIVRGDLTNQPDVDAIVNAANSSLLGGGGVDGAIHRAAGPALLDACRELRRTSLPDGLRVGRAVATPAFDLPNDWVIHTVGPIYDEHDPSDGDDYRLSDRPVPSNVDPGESIERSSTSGRRLHRSPEHLLASCYTESLAVADEVGARRVAFPAISCGVYGYPLAKAAPIALDSIAAAETDVELVRFVLFGDDALRAWQSAARR